MTLSEWIKAEPGRASALAAALGIRDPKSAVLIYLWANGRRQVPADRCPAIERETDGAVRCEDLRPDVDWGVLRAPAPDPEQARAA